MSNVQRRDASLRAGREAKLSADYGHSDLIFGLRAPEEIYPRIVAWLRAHSEAATAVPA